MWPFIILVGLFILDTILVIAHFRYTHQINSISVWIDEKQADLLDIKEAVKLSNNIDDHILRFESWIEETRQIIIPGILFSQLATAYVISSILDNVAPSVVIVNFVACLQAGVIVTIAIMAQRMLEAVRVTRIVNEEHIKWTVMKKADEIEAQGDNLNGEE